MAMAITGDCYASNRCSLPAAATTNTLPESSPVPSVACTSICGVRVLGETIWVVDKGYTASYTFSRPPVDPTSQLQAFRAFLITPCHCHLAYLKPTTNEGHAPIMCLSSGKIRTPDTDHSKARSGTVAGLCRLRTPTATGELALRVANFLRRAPCCMQAD